MSIYKSLKSQNTFFGTSYLARAGKDARVIDSYLHNSDFAAVKVLGGAIHTFRNLKNTTRRRRRNRVYDSSNEYQPTDVLNKTFFKSLKRFSDSSFTYKDIAIVNMGIIAISGDIRQIFRSNVEQMPNFEDFYIQIGELLKRCNKGREVSEVSKYVFCQLSNMLTTNGGDNLSLAPGLGLDLSDRFNEGVRFFNKKILQNTLLLDGRNLDKRLQNLDNAAHVLNHFYSRTPKVRSQLLINNEIEIRDELKILQDALAKSRGVFTKRRLRSRINKLNFELAKNNQEIRRVSYHRGGGEARLGYEYFKNLFDYRVLEYEGLKSEIQSLESDTTRSRKRQLKNEKRLKALNDDKDELLVEAYQALSRIDPSVTMDNIMEFIEARSDAMENESESLYPSFFSKYMIDSFTDKFLELQEVYKDRKFYIHGFDGVAGGFIKSVELPGSIREFTDSEEFKTLGIECVKKFFPKETGLAKLLEKSVRIRSFTDAQLIEYFSTIDQDEEYKGSFKYFCRDEFKNRLQDARFRNELQSFAYRADGKTAINMYFSLAKEFDSADIGHFLGLIQERGAISGSRTFEYLNCAKKIFANINEVASAVENLDADIDELVGAIAPFDPMKASLEKVLIEKVLLNIRKMQRLHLKKEYSAHVKAQLKNLLPIEKSKLSAEKFVELLEFCEGVLASKPDELNFEYYKEIERQANENDFELSEDFVDKVRLQFIREVSVVVNGRDVGMRRGYEQSSRQEAKSNPDANSKYQPRTAIDSSRGGGQDSTESYVSGNSFADQRSAPSARPKFVGSRVVDVPNSRGRDVLKEMTNKENVMGPKVDSDRSYPSGRLKSPYADQRIRFVRDVTQV